MKLVKLGICLLVVGALMALPGCAGGGHAGESPAAGASSATAETSSAASSEPESDSSASVSEAASSAESVSSEANQAVLVITANGTTFTAAFEDNSSAAAFADLLREGPVTVSLHDYGNFEKVGPLPQSLPTNDAQITTQPGDVILYQGNQVTIYYDQNTWSFTRLAPIDGATREGVLSVLGDGDVEVTFSLEG